MVVGVAVGLSPGTGGVDGEAEEVTVLMVKVSGMSRGVVSLRSVVGVAVSGMLGGGSSPREVCTCKSSFEAVSVVIKMLVHLWVPG